MDDASAWIEEWFEFSAQTRELINNHTGIEIDSEEFQQAYAEFMGKDALVELLYSTLPNPEDAFEKLKDFPFDQQSRTFVEEIVLHEDILPEGTLQLWTEETIKSRGQVWRIHANDQDPFPSSPHAHNLGTGLKLHLGTGDLYNKAKHVGSIGCKKLKRIRDALKKIKPPKYECS